MTNLMVWQIQHPSGQTIWLSLLSRQLIFASRARVTFSKAPQIKPPTQSIHIAATCVKTKRRYIPGKPFVRLTRFFQQPTTETEYPWWAFLLLFCDYPKLRHRASHYWYSINVTQHKYAPVHIILINPARLTAKPTLMWSQKSYKYK